MRLQYFCLLSLAALQTALAAYVYGTQEGPLGGQS
jgi:hypothetical protein